MSNLLSHAVPAAGRPRHRLAMKKLILICNDLYVRNFLQSGAFSKIEDDNTYYLATSDVKNLSELQKKKNFLGVIKVPRRHTLTYGRFLLPLLTFTNRDRSSSFMFRSQRYKTPTRLSYELLSTSFLHKPNIIRLIASLPLYSQDLYKRIKRLNPDIVIVPTSAIDYMAIDATLICKKLKIPILQLINGWDNISSKIVFPSNPDYLGVWGTQSVEHAESIHRIPQRSVFEIGSPHLDHYFRKKKEKSPSPYNFEYVLFAGCFLAFDEISALKMLDATIEKAKIKDLIVVYRPHPWRNPRACFDEFRPDEFKHVILDKQVADNYLKSKNIMSPMTPKDFLPSLDYYPTLLSNAKFVVCPLSTMLVESAIFEKEVLVIAYDDKVHITSPHKLFLYEHFKGIENLDGIWMCKDASKFGNMFLSMYRDLSDPNRSHKSRINEQLKYYIYHDDKTTYAERLKKVVDKITSSSKRKPSLISTQGPLVYLKPLIRYLLTIPIPVEQQPSVLP